MIRPKRWMGFVTYENILFPYEFDEESFVLQLYPPSEEVHQQYNDPWKLFESLSSTREHKWIPHICIYGNTAEGYAIIFNIQKDIKLYCGFPSFKVNWYYYHKEDFSEDSIQGFYIEGDEIDYFYPANNALQSKIQLDEEHKRIKSATVSAIEMPNIPCGSFDVVDGVEATVELIEYFNIHPNAKTGPLDSKSRLLVRFSSPTALEIVLKAKDCIYRFFRYIAYRKNISLNEVHTFVIDNDGYIKCIGCLIWRGQNKKENHPKASDRIIQYRFIKKIVPDLLRIMMRREIRLDHLCNSIEDTHCYSLSRNIMILAAFEGEFERIYGRDYGRSDSYKAVKQEVIDVLKKLEEIKTGAEKRHMKSFIKFIEKRDSSYKSRVVHALHDCEAIMCSTVCQKYQGSFEDIINGIGERMNVLRNQIAHCNLEVLVEPAHLNDFKVIEKLIYAMRFKNLGLDDENSKQAITHLFR